MTTATASPVSREIIEDRWRSAVTRPQVYVMSDGSRDTGLDNSKAFYAFEETIVDIATRLRGDGLSETQLEEVEGIAAALWDESIKARLLEWAQEHAR